MPWTTRFSRKYYEQTGILSRVGQTELWQKSLVNSRRVRGQAALQMPFLLLRAQGSLWPRTFAGAIKQQTPFLRSCLGKPSKNRSNHTHTNVHKTISIFDSPRFQSAKSMRIEAPMAGRLTPGHFMHSSLCRMNRPIEVSPSAPMACFTPSKFARMSPWNQRSDPNTCHRPKGNSLRS